MQVYWKLVCMSYDSVAKQFSLLEHQGGPVDLIGVKNELLDRLYIPGFVEWLIEICGRKELITVNILYAFSKTNIEVAT